MQAHLHLRRALSGGEATHHVLHEDVPFVARRPLLQALLVNFLRGQRRLAALRTGLALRGGASGQLLLLQLLLRALGRRPADVERERGHQQEAHDEHRELHLLEHRGLVRRSDDGARLALLVGRVELMLLRARVAQPADAVGVALLLDAAADAAFRVDARVRHGRQIAVPEEAGLGLHVLQSGAWLGAVRALAARRAHNR